MIYTKNDIKGELFMIHKETQTAINTITTKIEEINNLINQELERDHETVTDWDLYDEDRIILREIRKENIETKLKLVKMDMEGVLNVY